MRAEGAACIGHRGRIRFAGILLFDGATILIPRGDRSDVQRDDPRGRSQEHSALARAASSGRGRMRTARTVDGHH